MTARHTLLAGVVVGALLAGAAVAPAGATEAHAPPESLTVDVAADGDAQVTLVSRFDLDNESEAADFETLRANATARNATLARYTDHWTAAADRTDREMAVHNGSLTLSRTNGTGVATVTATWAGLAAVDDGVLTVDEPFASGFDPVPGDDADRRLVVVLPESHQLTSVSPGPTNSSDGRLVYGPGAPRDGLSITATSTRPESGTPAPTPTATGVATTGGSGPGVGVAGALAVLLAATALLAGRRG